MLFSCSNATASYAEKINEAAKAGEHYTYEKVVEDLGDEAIEIIALKSGIIIAVKGVTSEETLKEQINNGEKLEGIVVTIVAGKATSAAFKTITLDLFK